MEDVLYVPILKTNLYSLGRLLQKVFVVTMEDNSINVFDQSKKLIIHTGLSHNKTFQLIMNN